MKFLQLLLKFKYRLICLIIIILVFMIVSYYQILINQPCSTEMTDFNCDYRLKGGVYEPLYFGGQVLLLILGALFFVPQHIFKRWLLYVALPMLIIVYLLVIDISVYSSNPIIPSRGEMAKLAMYGVAVLTALFVLGHLIYDWWKKRKVGVKKLSWR